MTSRFTRCLLAGIGAAWVFFAPVHAEDGKLAPKEMPAGTAQSAAPRVSPYVKYAQAHAELHKDPVYPRVSGLMRRPHRVTPGRPSK